MTTRLEAIEAREREATPGEWANVGRSVRVDGTTGGNAWQGAICNTIGGGYQSRKADRVNVQARANAAFIAHARADIPLLLSIARAVAKWVLARQRELALPEHLEADAELDEYESILLEIAAAKDEMQAAIAPLLEEEK